MKIEKRQFQKFVKTEEKKIGFDVWMERVQNNPGTWGICLFFQ